MLNPEKRLVEELEIFLEEESEHERFTTTRIAYEEVFDKLQELKFDISREYNMIVP